jgi:hypothetical protein
MATQQDTRLLTGKLTWIEADGPDEHEIEVDGQWLRVTGACPDLRGQDVTILYREEGAALMVLRIEGRGGDGDHQVLWKRDKDRHATRHRPTPEPRSGRRHKPPPAEARSGILL